MYVTNIAQDATSEKVSPQQHKHTFSLSSPSSQILTQIINTFSFPLPFLSFSPSYFFFKLFFPPQILHFFGFCGKIKSLRSRKCSEGTLQEALVEYDQIDSAKVYDSFCCYEYLFVLLFLVFVISIRCLFLFFSSKKKNNLPPSIFQLKQPNYTDRPFA